MSKHRHYLRLDGTFFTYRREKGVHSIQSDTPSESALIDGLTSLAMATTGKERLVEVESVRGGLVSTGPTLFRAVHDLQVSPEVRPLSRVEVNVGDFALWYAHAHHEPSSTLRLSWRSDATYVISFLRDFGPRTSAQNLGRVLYSMTR